jgi:hypothetical protein
MSRATTRSASALHAITTFGAVLLAGCAGSSAQVPGFEAVSVEPTATTALMLRHYDHARALSSAAIFGQEAAARNAATALRAEQAVQGVAGEAGRAYVDFLAAVRVAEQASGRQDVARAAAAVSGSCGACHLASGIGPTFSVGRLADPVTPRDHIRVLAWGSSRLWEGLIGGSDLAWRAGARAFSEQRLREDLYESRASDPAAARRLGERLQELGVRALSTSDTSDRAALLGDVWGTCSGCHELVGVGD